MVEQHTVLVDQDGTPWFSVVIGTFSVLVAELEKAPGLHDNATYVFPRKDIKQSIGTLSIVDFTSWSTQAIGPVIVGSEGEQH